MDQRRIEIWENHARDSERALEKARAMIARLLLKNHPELFEYEELEDGD